MPFKYHLREIQEQEIVALFWDEQKKDYIFPSSRDMSKLTEELRIPQACRGIRTPDPRFTKPMLYRLSYAGIKIRE